MGEFVHMSEDRVATPCPSDTVIILGMGASNLDYMTAAYKGDLYDLHKKGDPAVWTVNYASFIYKNTLAWQMHDFNNPDEARWPGYKGPVMTTRADPNFDCIEYPFAEIVNEFQSQYFTNSVAYMVAYAMWSFIKSKKKACKRLVLFGCDYHYVAAPNVVTGKLNASPYEHGQQCVEHWLGRAAQLGIQIGVAERSTLLHTVQLRNPEFVPYGYEDTPPIFDGAKVIGFKTPEYMAKVNAMLENIPDTPEEAK